MSEGCIRLRTPLKYATGQARRQYHARGKVRKNPKHKENSRTRGRHGPRGGRTQNTPVLSTLDPVCRKLSRTKEKVRTFTGKRSCSMQVPYISDIIRQLDEVMKIFAIEKELRTIKNRGYFPVPHITPQDSKIETA